MNICEKERKDLNQYSNRVDVNVSRTRCGEACMIINKSRLCFCFNLSCGFINVYYRMKTKEWINIWSCMNQGLLLTHLIIIRENREHFADLWSLPTYRPLRWWNWSISEQYSAVFTRPMRHAQCDHCNWWAKFSPTPTVNQLKLK